MNTWERIAIKDFEITAENGDHFEIKRGEKYRTSGISDGKVTVFSNFWVKVPIEYFAGVLPKGAEPQPPQPEMPLREQIIFKICDKDGCQYRLIGSPCPCEQMIKIANDILAWHNSQLQKEYARFSEELEANAQKYEAQYAAIRADERKKFEEKVLKNSVFRAWDKVAQKWLEGEYAEEWARENTKLVYCDIEGIAVIEGDAYLLDECGNWEYLNPERFEISLELRAMAGKEASNE